MGDVFISYSRKDRTKVTSLVERLKKTHVDVCWHAHLTLGDEWDDEVEDALANADIVVVVWSESSIRSRQVKDEAFLARDLDKIIVPVIIEAVSPPYRYRRTQRFDLLRNPIEDDPQLESLVEAIRFSCQGRGSTNPTKEDDLHSSAAEPSPKVALQPAVRRTQPAATSVVPAPPAPARRFNLAAISGGMLIAGMGIVGAGYAFLGEDAKLAAFAGAVLIILSISFVVAGAISSRRR